MQHHPDPAELDSFLLGTSRTNVADSVIEHLLTCEQCMTLTALHRDYLQAARSTLKDQSAGGGMAQMAAALTSPAGGQYTMGPAGHYAWALLVPLTLAVVLLSNTGDSLKSVNTIAQTAFTQTRESLSSRGLIARHSSRDPYIDDGSFDFSQAPESSEVIPVRRPVHKRPIRRAVIARTFVVPEHPSITFLPPPILTLSAVDPEPMVFTDVSLEDSEALTLVAADFSVAPPPRRPALFRRFLSVLASTFKGS